jgi:hypothetical protein
MNIAPRCCPTCGEEPLEERDSAGLGVSAWVVWCEYCPADPATYARGMTRKRAVQVWNDRAAKLVRS